ncbi:hypothetical protein Pcinc_010323 [Petrolisthes cinctipes]|uniref:Phospholipase n=1 Tax=Petrolisthes cinctipes TaxID=88211 RepID=A0AAE1G3K4_PETCI|nr:hypothetical protein Pcinc_010323 [Petrolisthes cinctipes]
MNPIHQSRSKYGFSGSVMQSLRSRVSRRNVRQEMEPLAASEEAVDTSPRIPTPLHDPDPLTPQIHDEVQRQGREEGDDTSNGQAAVSSDVTDFSIQHALRQGGIKNKPSLRILATGQSPTLGSPDSDSDVLDYLDFTPDPFPDSDHGAGSVVFSKLYEQQQYQELMPGILVPNKPFYIHIIDIQALQSSISIFHNYLLVISLEHGDHKWIVKKKLRQVAALHSTLILLRTRVKLPAATRGTRLRRESMRQQIKAFKSGDTVDGEDTQHSKRVLKFPRRSLQVMDDEVRADLETYVRNLLHHSLFRSHRAVLEFFEISPVSFIRELGEKSKEGFVKKRTGGNDTNTCGCCAWLASAIGGKYKERWLVVRDTCLFFMVPETGCVRSVMLMDTAFQVTHGYRMIGARNSLLINNLSRSMIIKCDSEMSKKEWLAAITGAQSKYATDFTKQDIRYGSYAPVRGDSYARWYVDGARYMWDVADILEAAKEEIFITDWWMCPQIYLKRPDLTGHRWRLQEVLKRKAEAGVRVFIMLYKEVELALGISSLQTKQALNTLHPNIKVLRHPDHIAGGVLYWAHHEKVVVVDQTYAFVSGIDLAFGRWDDYRHKLVDVGHAGVQNNQPSPRGQGGGVGGGISKGALQHLVRGTNEVLVSTVSRSNPSSRCSSPVSRPTSPYTHTTAPPSQQSSPPSRRSSFGAGPNTTMSTTLSYDVLHPSDSDLTARPETETTLDDDNITKRVDSESNVKSKQIKGEREKKTAEFEYKWNALGNSSDGASQNSMQGQDVTDFRHSSRTAPSVTMSDTDITSVYKKNGKPSQEDTPLRQPTKKSNAKARFHLHESKSLKETVRSEDSGSEDERRNRKKVGKSFREVRRMGLDLMEEVREKSREVRAWTAHKLPHLHRRGSSMDSDNSTDEEQDQDSGTSFYQRNKNRLGLKGRAGSCSSLAAAHNEVTMMDTTSIHLWVGKDYVNWISKDLDNLDEPFKDSVDRHQTPRMPWHDIGLFVEGRAARDVARHFIQRWNAVKTEKVKANHSFPYLVPRTYDRASFSPSSLQPKHRVKCQVVRSVGKWSAGLDDTESSIFQAYVDMIRGARHYIYIENQFFITRANTSQREVFNNIGFALVDRIVKAHQNNENFRVYVLLPLLPAFEGMIGKSSGIAMQYIVYWNYVSISRGKSSVIQSLKERGVTDWMRYITFCSLRTHELLGSRPISELIYIHSKLMIVDDCKVIAGSANINDRSLKGDRDSELCLVIEDQEFETGMMNGCERDVGVFAGSMRRYIFSEHLGLADVENPHIDVSDPVVDSFFTDVWCRIAQRNTEIYEEVFSCYPCNSATTFEAVDELRRTATLAEVSPMDAMVKLQEVQGHLVKFPLDFLKNETLRPGVGNKEYLLPMETWT